MEQVYYFEIKKGRNYEMDYDLMFTATNLKGWYLITIRLRYYKKEIVKNLRKDVISVIWE